jgi:exosortase A-associated hydrolase 1
MVLAGGPQYRVGGHRQSTLWARRLAEEGYPVFRFDYRGVGDSHGEFRGYDFIDDDIRAAIDRFAQEQPGLTEIVLWGECNAASAILFYAYRDARVRGLVLLNPWARTQEGQARTLLRHYYLSRLKDPGFWRKVAGLRFNPLAALGDLARNAYLGFKSRASRANRPAAEYPTAPLSRDAPLPERLLAGFSRFQGPAMLVMSGRDLIAREFDEVIRANPGVWEAGFRAKPCTRHDTHDGDHTFASAEQRARVVNWALSWLASR